MNTNKNAKEYLDFMAQIKSDEILQLMQGFLEITSLEFVSFDQFLDDFKAYCLHGAIDREESFNRTSTIAKELGAVGGKSKSNNKRLASIENGKKGGRPKKTKKKKKSR